MKDLFLIISDQLHDIINLCKQDPSIYSFEKETSCLYHINKNCELLESIDVREHCQKHIVTSDESWLLYLVSIVCPGQENIIKLPDNCFDSDEEPIINDCPVINDCLPTNNICPQKIQCHTYYPDLYDLNHGKQNHGSIFIPTHDSEDSDSFKKKKKNKLCKKKLKKLLEIIKLEDQNYQNTCY